MDLLGYRRIPQRRVWDFEEQRVFDPANRDSAILSAAIGAFGEIRDRSRWSDRADTFRSESLSVLEPLLG